MFHVKHSTCAQGRQRSVNVSRETFTVCDGEAETHEAVRLGDLAAWRLAQLARRGGLTGCGWRCRLSLAEPLVLQDSFP